MSEGNPRIESRGGDYSANVAAGSIEGDVNITQVLEQTEARISNLRDQRRELVRFVKFLNYRDSLTKWNFEGVLFQMALGSLILGFIVTVTSFVGLVIFLAAIGGFIWLRIRQYRKRLKSRRLIQRGTQWIETLEQEINTLNQRVDAYKAEVNRA